MAGKKSSGPSFLKVLLFPLRLALWIFLPFFLLIRSSVFAHEYFEMPAWACLLVGSTVTFVLVFFYLIRFSRLIYGKKKKERESARRFSLRAAIVVVLGFLGYATLYISANNAKTTQVKGEFFTVHPLVRLALSTVTLFDRDLVVTDMSRVPGDYKNMNLTSKKKSLHYPQGDGYVHAVDLRTKGRAEWRNTMLSWYFTVMGFRTLRHVGSADHLHISLMIHENPGAL